MKKLSFLALCFLGFFAVGCYDDSALKESINSLDKRVKDLETWQSVAENNISTLFTLVEGLGNKVFVTSVTESSEGGYVIEFSNGKKAVIKDGAPGSTPQIGVKQGADGVYYWTLDGEWLLGSDGGKLRVTGEDGAPGAPGITPRLKIEDGYWYVSTDEGATWTRLAQATGDPGTPGDSFFKDVRWDDSFVYIVLQDDTELKFSRGAAGNITITAVPTLKDGVGLNDGPTRVRFEVLPESAAESLAALPADNFRFNLAYTHTRALAGDVEELPVVKAELSKNWLVLTVDCSSIDPKLKSGSLDASASLSVYDGANYITTGYFPVYYDKDYARKSISRQWKYVYDSGTTVNGEPVYVTQLFDFGASFESMFLYWSSYDKPEDSASLQFIGPFEVESYSDGRIAAYDNSQDYYCLFEDVTETSTRFAIFYLYDPSSYEGEYAFDDAYGWYYGWSTLTVNEPFQQLNWEQWCIAVGGNNYAFSANVDKDGYDHREHLLKDVLGNSDRTLTMVRMNNAGTAEDFAAVNVKGKIAVVDRGEIPFWQKCKNASEAGAIAVLCANNVPGITGANMDNFPSDANKIPFIAISQKVGEELNGKTSVSFVLLKDPRLFSGVGL